MPNTTSQFNIAGLAPACIVSVSLLASALIVANRPAISAAHETSTTSPTTLPKVPPLTQASASEQLRRQLLAAPEVNTFRQRGKIHRLTEVEIKQVIYSAKTDQFTIVHKWLWQPSLKSRTETYSTFNNDGYGHYYGLVVLSPVLNGTGQYTDVTLK